MSVLTMFRYPPRGPRPQPQTAETLKYRDKALVEEFIVEIEGAAKNCDVTRWGQFADIKDFRKEMFKRLENHFESWLNP